MSDDEPSVGEMVRRLKRIEDKLDNGKFVTADYHKAVTVTLKERVESLNHHVTWLTRALITAFGLIILETAVALLAFLLVGMPR